MSRPVLLLLIHDIQLINFVVGNNMILCHKKSSWTDAAGTKNDNDIVGDSSDSIVTSDHPFTC